MKPKGEQDSENNSTEETNVDSSSSETSTANGDDDITLSPGGTSANVDDSVILSELKALRQSSISLSASQKQGATQIIKDWMTDGSPEDSDDKTTSESNEGEG